MTVRPKYFGFRFKTDKHLSIEETSELVTHLGPILDGNEPWTIVDDRIILCSNETQIMTVAMVVAEESADND